MIWQARIEACADLAHIAALDVTWNNYHRVDAVRVLLACGRDATARNIADAILADPAAWPDKIVLGPAADLFPKIISVNELVTLMERTRETKRTIGGFGWVLNKIVEAVEPASELAVVLRDKWPN